MYSFSSENTQYLVADCNFFITADADTGELPLNAFNVSNREDGSHVLHIFIDDSFVLSPFLAAGIATNSSYKSVDGIFQEYFRMFQSRVKACSISDESASKDYWELVMKTAASHYFLVGAATPAPEKIANFIAKFGDLCGRVKVYLIMLSSEEALHNAFENKVEITDGMFTLCAKASVVCRDKGGASRAY